jgi:hypothetical protein
MFKERTSDSQYLLQLLLYYFDSIFFLCDDIFVYLHPTEVVTTAGRRRDRSVRHGQPCKWCELGSCIGCVCHE